jgi:hypothetical protein
VVSSIPPSKLVYTTTAFVFVLCYFLDVYVSILYHGVTAVPPILVTLVIATFVTLTPVFFVAALLSNALTAITALVYVFFFAYTLLRPLTAVLLPALAMPVKILIVLAAVALAVAIERFASPATKIKLFRFFLGAASTWLIATPVAALYYERFSPEASTFDLRSVINPQPIATVFVVLDELSPAYASVVTSYIPSRDFLVTIGAAKKAGQSTVNAIPSMLTGLPHDDVAPCGAAVLCGSGGFSPARLKATLPNTDVVGFYHPYCEIRGLRFCYRITSRDLKLSATAAQILWAASSIIPIIGGITLTAFPNLSKNQELTATTVRETIRAKTFQAPFWTKGGGILFVHQLLPHPSGVASKNSLKSEYEDNVRVAAMFVSELVSKLSATFGQDFVLIVTSDHPLRVEMWCASPQYAGEFCSKGLPAAGTHVPFIIITDKNSSIRTPAEVDLLGVLTKK